MRWPRPRPPRKGEDTFLPEITEVLLRVARAQAWDEGFNEGYLGHLDTTNPYREDKNR